MSLNPLPITNLAASSLQNSVQSSPPSTELIDLQNNQQFIDLQNKMFQKLESLEEKFDKLHDSINKENIENTKTEGPKLEKEDPREKIMKNQSFFSARSVAIIGSLTGAAALNGVAAVATCSAAGAVVGAAIGALFAGVGAPAGAGIGAGAGAAIGLCVGAFKVAKLIYDQVNHMSKEQSKREDTYQYVDAGGNNIENSDSRWQRAIDFIKGDSENNSSKESFKEFRRNPSTEYLKEVATNAQHTWKDVRGMEEKNLEFPRSVLKAVFKQVLGEEFVENIQELVKS